MRWQGRRRSDNVEDRRGIGGRGIAVGGGLGGVLLVALFLLLGGNPDEVMQNIQTEGTYSTEDGTQQLSEKDKELGEFVSVVLADIEDVWGAVFSRSGETYREPRLVLFTNQVSSACGYASADG